MALGAAAVCWLLCTLRDLECLGFIGLPEVGGRSLGRGLAPVGAAVDVAGAGAAAAASAL